MRAGTCIYAETSYMGAMPLPFVEWRGLKGVERRPLPTYIIAHIWECDGVEVAPHGGVVRAALTRKCRYLVLRYAPKGGKRLIVE